MGLLNVVVENIGAYLDAREVDGVLVQLSRRSSTDNVGLWLAL